MIAVGEGRDPSIRVDIDGAIAQLTFQREEAANAIDLVVATAFRDIVTRLVADERTRVVVIMGSERFFCAGGDVAAMLAHDDRGSYLRKLASTMHEGIAALAESRLIVVAAVQGTAAGAGFALVLDADIVLAAPTASFVSAYTQVGLTPDTGFSSSVSAVVGAHRAKELVLLNRRLDATTAFEWGIVNEVVPSASFLGRVNQVAQSLAGAAVPATAEAKRLLAAAPSRSLVDQLADESDTISRMVETPDAQARITAFAARITPKGNAS